MLYLEELECRLNPGVVSPLPIIAFTSPAQTLTAGQESSQVAVQVQDAFGNPFVGELVDLRSSSATGTFSAASGGDQTSTLQVTTDANGDASFYYEDAAVGTPTLTATDDSNASVSMTQTETIASLQTISSWNGTSYVYPFGYPDTATYGEAFIAPADTTLSDFSFRIQGTAGVHLSIKAYVFAWSGSLPFGSGQPVGSALFSSSSSFSFDGNANDSFQTVTVQTGGTPLQAGQAYVAFLTVSNPADYAASTGTTNWGLVSGHPSGDGGGSFVYDNNENYFGRLTTDTWNNYGNDLAFTVDFGASVGTPPSVTTQPANQTVVAGATAPFSAAASGSPSPSVQWEAEAPGADGFSAISDGALPDGAVYSGTQTGTLTINHAAADLTGYQFEAVFTNGVGQPVTSNPATLTVASQIVSTAPALTVTAGANTGTFTFQVEDRNGNPVALAGQVIQLKTSDPNTGQFIGANNGAVTTGANGSASFTYTDTQTGTPTLTLTDANLNFSVTRQLTVISAPVSQIAFVQMPTDTKTGQPISPDVVVRVVDGFGNPHVGDIVTLTANGPNGAQKVGTAKTDVNGVADFTNVVLNTSGAYTVTASLVRVIDGVTVSSPFSSSFTEFPAAVTLTPSGAQVNASVPSVPVGASFGLSGTFIDQGQGPPGGALVRISWGDGTVDTDPVTVGNGQGAFTASHNYQNQGAFSVTVLVTDAAGNVIGVGALAAPVEALPAGAGTVNTVDVPPGATVTQSVTDVVSGTITTTTLTVAPGDTGGELITAEVKNFVPPPAAGRAANRRVVRDPAAGLAAGRFGADYLRRPQRVGGVRHGPATLFPGPDDGEGNPVQRRQQHHPGRQYAGRDHPARQQQHAEVDGADGHGIHGGGQHARRRDRHRRRPGRGLDRLRPGRPPGGVVPEHQPADVDPGGVAGRPGQHQSVVAERRRRRRRR